MNGRRKQGEQNDKWRWLTSRVVYVKKGSKRISFGDQPVSYFSWNAFIAIFSMNLKNLKKSWQQRRLNKEND